MIRRSFLLWMMLGCGLLVWQTQVWSVQLIQLWRDQQHAPNVDDIAIRHTYQLTREWLRFPVSARANKVRMLTAAVMRRPLPAIDYSEVRQGWRYAIEVELVDAQRKTVYREITHYRSNVREYLLPGQSQFVTPSRFKDPSLVPLSTRQLQLPMENYHGRILEARVRLVSADTEIDSVTVRCASIVERIGYDDPDLWHPVKGPLVASEWGIRFIAEQYETLSRLAAGDNTVLVVSPVVLADYSVVCSAPAARPWLFTFTASPLNSRRSARRCWPYWG